MRQPIRRLVLLLATLLLIAPAASAQEPQGRPGVIRVGNDCNQTTDTHGDFDDIGRKIPCDDRYKEAEKIAYFEFNVKTNLKIENSLITRAELESWLASAASGATTLNGRLDAWDVERRKQAEQHADASKPFLSQECRPNDEGEKNKELEWGCKFDETRFQRFYWFALQGDHQAQEYVASCFENNVPSALSLASRWPCHRVVNADETMMCAWYLVAASSGHPKSAKSAEKYGYIYECDKKPMYERQAILGTASALFLRIYHRPMPVAR
jgi:hypothetical protein